MQRLSRGFTLVEMLVVAPIVILAIAAFIAAIVNMTGDVLSSRGANSLAYDVQDALNRIEADTKLSTTTLAVNNVSVATTQQGYVANGSTTPGGSTVNFTNIDNTATGGSPASLILNGLVTNANPLSGSAGIVYLANSPNSCSDPTQYSKNTPMTMNIVYYISNNSLWRRVIMPSNYADPNARCGSAPWQQPSCLPGYSVAFCVTNDEDLVDGVTPANFSVQYFNSASSTTPNTVATSSTTSDANRNTALQSTPTLVATITATKTIAGRAISRTGNVRVTRLDTNATSIAQNAPPTSAPSAPSVSSVVSNGHNVTFSWPSVPTATSYSLSYQINGGAWVVGSSNIDNNTRSFTVTQGGHTDTVTASVTATNAAGTSTAGTNTITIPLWAPLLLINGWGDYGQGYTTAAYTKTKSGAVYIKGLVKNPGTPAVNTVIAQLPSDYVPSGGRLLFGVSTSTGGSNGSARADVDASGNIIYSDSGNPGWFALDTIHYMSAGGAAQTNITSFLNGWSNYNAGYAPASYSQDPNTSRVFVQGLLNIGTNTDGTNIFTLPSTFAPSQYEHMGSRSATWHHVGVVGTTAGTPAIQAKGTGSGAYSINLTYLPGSYSSWTTMTLQNSWAAYGGYYDSPQYAKTSDGVVSLKGLIKAGSTNYGTIITTLPAGFRPKQEVLYTTPDWVSSAVYARIDVLPNGQVLYYGQANGNPWLSLDGIVFMGEQ